MPDIQDFRDYLECVIIPQYIHKLRKQIKHRDSLSRNNHGHNFNTNHSGGVCACGMSDLDYHAVHPWDRDIRAVCPERLSDDT